MKKTRFLVFISGAIVLLLQSHPTAAGHGPAPDINPQAISVGTPNALAKVELPRKTAVKANLDFGRMPLYFIANQGQVDNQASYYVQGKEKTLYFTDHGVTFALAKSGEEKTAALVSWPSDSVATVGLLTTMERPGLTGRFKRRGPSAGSSSWALSAPTK